MTRQLEQPKVEAKKAALLGDSRRALVRVSEDAKLLVMGSHGSEGYTDYDVVVVRAPPSPLCGEIVVGLDVSPTSGVIGRPTSGACGPVAKALADLAR
ncbi:hypothetical protein [Nonomuraea solani]|uniref:hypothetical protein n=1 Tax=Nonomuraea solani TaxID=1144553 RepID=UPI0011B013E6|nr:hypothetical protein [Nonomuraea solani]